MVIAGSHGFGDFPGRLVQAVVGVVRRRFSRVCLPHDFLIKRFRAFPALRGKANQQSIQRAAMRPAAHRDQAFMPLQGFQRLPRVIRPVLLSISVVIAALSDGEHMENEIGFPVGNQPDPVHFLLPLSLFGYSSFSSFFSSFTISLAAWRWASRLGCIRAPRVLASDRLR